MVYLHCSQQQILCIQLKRPMIGYCVLFVLSICACTIVELFYNSSLTSPKKTYETKVTTKVTESKRKGEVTKEERVTRKVEIQEQPVVIVQSEDDKKKGKKPQKH